VKLVANNIDHIGIAVNDIDQVIKFYTDVLGLELQGMETLPEHGVRVAIIKTDRHKIELMEPLTKESPLAKFIEKRGEGLHHLGLKVIDVSKAITEFQDKGITLIDRVPRPGVGKNRIAFVHPRESKVLLELVETANDGNNTPKPRSTKKH